VILSNRSSAPVPLQATAHRIAAIALREPIPEPVPVAVGRSVLEGLEGRYQGGDVGTCTVAFDGSALTAEVPGIGTIPLIPVGPTTFRTPLVTWRFTFETDASGRGIRMRVRDWKLDDVAARFTPPAVAPRQVVAVPESDLTACAGTYESLNGILVTVERAVDHLSIHPFAQAPIEVFPVAPLVFASRDGAVEYRFVRDGTGAVAGYQRAAGGTPVPARRLR
jgi:hypothetical protein